MPTWAKMAKATLTAAVIAPVLACAATAYAQDDRGYERDSASSSAWNSIGPTGLYLAVGAGLNQPVKSDARLHTATGTVPTKPETPENAPGLEDQPFPSEAAEFRLVHVANGRAMIEDDAGLWVVQQGAALPDSTRVKSIEKRNGRWVLVTSADRVVELSK